MAAHLSRLVKRPLVLGAAVGVLAVVLQQVLPMQSLPAEPERQGVDVSSLGCQFIDGNPVALGQRTTSTVIVEGNGHCRTP